MSRYSSEYFEGYGITDEVIALLEIHGFENSSWHNDICPSFEKGVFRIWLDLSDSAWMHRNDTEDKSYNLVDVTYSPYNEETEHLWEVDDWAEECKDLSTAIRFVNDKLKELQKKRHWYTVDCTIDVLSMGEIDPESQLAKSRALESVRSMDAEELKKKVIESLQDADAYLSDFVASCN